MIASNSYPIRIQTQKQNRTIRSTGDRFKLSSSISSSEGPKEVFTSSAPFRMQASPLETTAGEKSGLVKSLTRIAGIACLALLAGCTMLGPTSLGQDVAPIPTEPSTKPIEMPAWRRDAYKLSGPGATREWVGQQLLQQSLKHYMVDGFLLSR